MHYVSRGETNIVGGLSATLTLPDYGRVARNPPRIVVIISRSLQIFFLTLTLRYPRQSEELEGPA